MTALLATDTPAPAGAADVRAALETAASAIKQARTWLDGTPGLDAREQRDLLRQISSTTSRLQSLRTEVLARAERERTAIKEGFPSTAAWAGGATHGDQRDFAGDVQLGTALDEDHLDTTKQAFADGDLSQAHVRIIAKAVHDLPEHATDDDREAVENDLVKDAKKLTPSQLRRRARRALALIEPDPDVVDEHENDLVRDEETKAWAKTQLTLHHNDDGTVTGRFTIPKLAAAILATALDRLTSPRRAALGHETTAATGTPGERRDPAHQRGLAFCEILEHLPTDHLPTATPIHLLVTTSLEQLQSKLRVAQLETGSPLSAGETRRLACQHDLIPAVLGSKSATLDLGRRTRLFGTQHRRALGLRYDSCAADGCERPYAWCELHHIVPWTHGGPTNADNALPLCWFHHRRIHDGAFGHRLRDGRVTFYRRT